MTQIEFLPYQNYHIRFKLINGDEQSGVILPTTSMNHRFIQTRNLIEWKLAEKNNDQARMHHLEKKIDISNIVWAERIKF